MGFWGFIIIQIVSAQAQLLVVKLRLVDFSLKAPIERFFKLKGPIGRLNFKVRRVRLGLPYELL